MLKKKPLCNLTCNFEKLSSNLLIERDLLVPETLGSTKEYAKRGGDEKPGLNSLLVGSNWKTHQEVFSLSPLSRTQHGRGVFCMKWCIPIWRNTYVQPRHNALVVSLGVRCPPPVPSLQVCYGSLLFLSCYSLGLSRLQHEHPLLEAWEWWFSLYGADRAVVTGMGSSEIWSAVGLRHLARAFAGQRKHEACWPGCILLISL